MSNDILKIDTSAGLVGERTGIEKVETFNLVPEDDPILLEVLPDFDFDNPPVKPERFASNLVETCKFHKGIGLSANQCGFRYRVFVMGFGENYVAHFNPKIVSVSEETVHMMEGCLSFNHLWIAITRPASVTVQFQNHLGEHIESTYTGLTARCFLHEYDHMEGIVYTNKAKPLALKAGKDKRAKLRKRMKKVYENMAARV
jgi:peptide deformylase